MSMKRALMCSTLLYSGLWDTRKRVDAYLAVQDFTGGWRDRHS